MGLLTPDEDRIVQAAKQRGLLALPTLGFSLLFVPILWVVQHEITAGRIARLRERLESQAVGQLVPHP